MERRRFNQHRYQTLSPPSFPPPSSSSSSSSSSQNRAGPSNPPTNPNKPCQTHPHWRSRGGARGSIRTPQEDQEEERVKVQEEKEEDFYSFPSLVGTCPYMCPDGERAQRERLRDLAVFERLHGDPGKTSPGLAVKKFCRTISPKNVDPSEVRPLPLLEDTLSYLLNLLDSSDYPFEVVHDFIFDRMRSIRQDLTMQNICDIKAISMYEKMVKFHVISHLKLRCFGKNLSSSSMHYLNMEQLQRALSSLYNLYDVNRDSNSVHEKEAEFRSLYILLHLDSRTPPTGESLSLWFCHVTCAVLHSKEMRFARSVLRFFRLGYYKQFLCTIAAEASYLQYCILEPNINEVRALCLSCVNNVGYKLHPYPLIHLSKLLMMKGSDLERLCHACGLETFTDEMGNKLLYPKQTTFCCPKGGFQSCEFPGFEQFEK